MFFYKLGLPCIYFMAVISNIAGASLIFDVPEDDHFNAIPAVTALYPNKKSNIPAYHVNQEITRYSVTKDLTQEKEPNKLPIHSPANILKSNIHIFDDGNHLSFDMARGDNNVQIEQVKNRKKEDLNKVSHKIITNSTTNNATTRTTKAVKLTTKAKIYTTTNGKPNKITVLKTNTTKLGMLGTANGNTTKHSKTTKILSSSKNTEDNNLHDVIAAIGDIIEYTTVMTIFPSQVTDNDIPNITLSSESQEDAEYVHESREMPQQRPLSLNINLGDDDDSPSPVTGAPNLFSMLDFPIKRLVTEAFHKVFTYFYYLMWNIRSNVFVAMKTMTIGRIYYSLFEDMPDFLNVLDQPDPIDNIMLDRKQYVDLFPERKSNVSKHNMRNGCSEQNQRMGLCTDAGESRRSYDIPTHNVDQAYNSPQQGPNDNQYYESNPPIENYDVPPTPDINQYYQTPPPPPSFNQLFQPQGKATHSPLQANLQSLIGQIIH